MQTDIRQKSGKMQEIILNARRRAAEMNAAIAAVRARRAAEKAAAAEKSAPVAPTAPTVDVGSYQSITGRSEPPSEIEAAPETTPEQQAEESEPERSSLPPTPSRWRAAAPRQVEELPNRRELYLDQFRAPEHRTDAAVRFGSGRALSTHEQREQALADQLNRRLYN